jgi:hypothetical protein
MPARAIMNALTIAFQSAQRYLSCPSASGQVRRKGNVESRSAALLQLAAVPGRKDLMASRVRRRGASGRESGHRGP